MANRRCCSLEGTYAYDDVTYAYDDVTGGCGKQKMLLDDVTYAYDVTYTYDDVTCTYDDVAGGCGKQKMLLARRMSRPGKPAGGPQDQKAVL